MLPKITEKVTVIIALHHHSRINAVFPVINLLPGCKLGLFRHLENAAIQPGSCMTYDLLLSIALTQDIQ